MADVSSLDQLADFKYGGNILWPILYCLAPDLFRNWCNNTYHLEEGVFLFPAIRIQYGPQYIAPILEIEVPPLLPWFLQLGPAMAAANNAALLGEDLLYPGWGDWGDLINRISCWACGVSPIHSSCGYWRPLPILFPFQLSISTIYSCPDQSMVLSDGSSE